MEDMLRGIGTLRSDVERNAENMDKKVKTVDDAVMAKIELLTTEASVSRFRSLVSVCFFYFLLSRHKPPYQVFSFRLYEGIRKIG